MIGGGMSARAYLYALLADCQTELGKRDTPQAKRLWDRIEQCAPSLLRSLRAEPDRPRCCDHCGEYESRCQCEPRRMPDGWFLDGRER